MIQISIPSNFSAERCYIIDILLEEFLGLKYEIAIKEDVHNYILRLENGSELIVEDHFFGHFSDGLSYLDEKNIPSAIKLFQNPFDTTEPIPILYGNDKCEASPRRIVCGLDIFASSFFMLSRWEEFTVKQRDNHNRFSAKSSLAFRYNFLGRPIVNEYTEVLWNMLKYLEIQQEKKERKFELLLTHDVDILKYWKNIGGFFKEMAGDVIKRRDLKLFFDNLTSFSLTKLRLQNDPFDTFDYLMTISERFNTKSYFFFMSGGLSPYDRRYDILSKPIESLIQKINKRGHRIGMHPSYESYNNAAIWREEYAKLSKAFPQPIRIGRQHYLRFEVPTTWQIWEDNGMEWDSTLGFAEREGFRCGVCYEYSVFNIIARKKLNLKEKPLVAMERNFVHYQKVTSEYMKNKLCELINIVKRYNGSFVFLWHNSSFNVPEWKNYQNNYLEVLNFTHRI